MDLVELESECDQGVLCEAPKQSTEISCLKKGNKKFSYIATVLLSTLSVIS